MDGQIDEIIMGQLLKDTQEWLTTNGAEPSLATLDLYFFIGKIGYIMRDAGSRKKEKTLTMLREWSEDLIASGEPTQIAKGFLISAFAAECFDLNKLLR